MMNIPRYDTSPCCGSMAFWCGSGSADPCLRLMDKEPEPEGSKTNRSDGSGFDPHPQHWYEYQKIIR
jgi:hypothetical protein